MAESRFERCLAEVLAREGGYVDNPADPGGATNMGITHKTLARWRRVSPWWDLPKSAVRALEREEAACIYRALYWDICRGDALPAGIDLATFDFAVNSGPERALRTLQAVLGVAVDAIVGPETLAAVQRAEPRKTIGALCDRRLAFLRTLAGFATFGRGWTSRVAAVRAAALAMVADKPSMLERNVPMNLLSGYKTYIIAAFMLLAGVAQIMGVELPALDGSSAGGLVLEALAVIFLRKSFKAGADRS